jgi:hypothetical protein
MKTNKTQNKEVTVLIKSLEKMESIVSKNKSLSWDGWNVVELVRSPSAVYKTNGARVNGVWYIKNIFSLDQDGWKVPSKYTE